MTTTASLLSTTAPLASGPPTLAFRIGGAVFASLFAGPGEAEQDEGGRPDAAGDGNILPVNEVAKRDAAPASGDPLAWLAAMTPVSIAPPAAPVITTATGSIRATPETLTTAVSRHLAEHSPLTAVAESSRGAMEQRGTMVTGAMPLVPVAPDRALGAAPLMQAAPASVRVAPDALPMPREPDPTTPSSIVAIDTASPATPLPIAATAATVPLPPAPPGFKRSAIPSSLLGVTTPSSIDAIDPASLNTTPVDAEATVIVPLSPASSGIGLSPIPSSPLGATTPPLAPIATTALAAVVLPVTTSESGAATPPTRGDAIAPSNDRAVLHAAAPPLERISLPTAADPLPPTTTAPAAQVFAAALHRFTEAEAATRREADDGGVTALAAPTLSSLSGTQTNLAVAAAVAPDTRLDTAQRHWPEAMIARITALRDASDALAATAAIGSDHAKIRLSPDALGSVEVSIERRDDRVHVAIAADRPQAQALLTDAQPRLAELAEQRGIRLHHGGAMLDARAGGEADRGTPHARAERASTTNRLADASSGEGTGDDRVA